MTNPPRRAPRKIMRQARGLLGRIKRRLTRTVATAGKRRAGLLQIRHVHWNQVRVSDGRRQHVVRLDDPAATIRADGGGVVRLHVPDVAALTRLALSGVVTGQLRDLLVRVDHVPEWVAVGIRLPRVIRKQSAFTWRRVGDRLDLSFAWDHPHDVHRAFSDMLTATTRHRLWDSSGGAIYATDRKAWLSNRSAWPQSHLTGKAPSLHKDDHGRLMGPYLPIPGDVTTDGDSRTGSLTSLLANPYGRLLAGTPHRYQLRTESGGPVITGDEGTRVALTGALSPESVAERTGLDKYALVACDAAISDDYTLRVLRALAAGGAMFTTSDDTVRGELETYGLTVVADPDAVTDLTGYALSAAASRRMAVHADPALRRTALGDGAVGMGRRAGRELSLPSITVVMSSMRPDDVPACLSYLAAQTYPSLEMVIGTHGYSVDATTREAWETSVPFPIRVVGMPAEHTLGMVLAHLSSLADGDLITKVDDDDHYGPHHVTDLFLAWHQSGADLVAKGARFVSLPDLGITIDRQWAAREQFNVTPAGGTLLLSRGTLEQVGGWSTSPRRVDADLIARIRSSGGLTYRTHALGYVYVRRTAGHTWPAEIAELLKQGEQTYQGLPDLMITGDPGDVPSTPSLLPATEPETTLVSSHVAATSPEPTSDPQVPRVVLVRDSRIPNIPGVCCFRRGVHEAFVAAGATVSDASWQAPQPGRQNPTVPATSSTPRKQRGAWLPQGLHGPARAAYRFARAAASRMSGLAKRLKKRLTHLSARVYQTGAVAQETGTPPLPGVSGADLVIAESADAAAAAAQSGVPRHRLWAVVTPEEPLFRPADSEEARKIASVAGKVAGFVVDSVDSQESVERVTSGDRTRTIVYPMIARDRHCATCNLAAGQSSETGDLAANLANFREALTAVRGTSNRAADIPPLTAWSAQAELGALAPDQQARDFTSTWTAAAQNDVARALLRTDDEFIASSARPTRKIMITGFDLKFVRELGNRLDERPDFDVTLDPWPALSRKSDQTEDLADTADTIVAEWARPSAVWLSERKRPDQLLIVRLHRYEIEHDYPRQIDIGNVDGVVYIAPLMGRRIRDELGWPERKLVHIPNSVDTAWFDRPKLPDARFGLGLVGALPMIKRLDLALDVLAAVRAVEPRFTLFIRSELPWRNKYVWATPGARAYYNRCFERIERDPLLRGSVVFDIPGRDMARWFRRVGHILSLSDLEGSHTALAEGMASGAVPVVRPWAGADEIYGSEWISSSTGEAVASVLTTAADQDTWLERAARAKDEIRDTHNPHAVERAWADLLHGDIGSAREHFARYANLGSSGLGDHPKDVSRA